MNPKTTIVLGSLLGACAIQLITAACGSSRSTGGPSNSGDAYAQGTSSSSGSSGISSCTAWQTAVSFYTVSVPSGWTTSVNSLPMNQALAVGSVPAGWEPVAVETAYYDSSTGQVTMLIHMRQCSAH
jgi:hypothetical protein